MQPDQVSTAIENNTTEYFLSLGHSAHDEIFDTPDFKYVLNDRWNCRILHARLPEQDADAHIEAIRERLVQRNLFALWLVTPSSGPGSLEQRLVDHSFSFYRYWSSMAMCTKALPTLDMPRGLKITEVMSDDVLKIWASLMVKNFEIDEDIAGSYRSYFTDIGAGERNIRRYYIGHIDEVPVATASLFYGTGAAGIYYISTLKGYESKGIGTAMTCHVVREARNSGYEIAVLNASDQGVSMYKRIGFKEYYWTKIFQSE
jgi:ribosomal protein S18 acetylase RimI-like enzyme